MLTKVRLSPYLLQRGTEIAIAKYNYAIRHGDPITYGVRQDLQRQISGTQAEVGGMVMTVPEVYNWRIVDDFRGNLPDYEWPSIGLKADGKSIEAPNHRLMIPEEQLHRDWVYILLSRWELPDVSMLCWCTGEEVYQWCDGQVSYPSQKRLTPTPTWVVTQKQMHPIKTFEDLLISLKEKYHAAAA